MRIGIDARMYGSCAATGIGVYIQALIDELISQDKTNQYFIFLREPVYSSWQPVGNNVTKIKADINWYSLAEQVKLPRLLKKYNLDLMHFPHFNVPIFYRRNYIVTIHDITPKFFPGPLAKKYFWRRWAYDFIFRRGLKRAKKIIAISLHTKNNLIKYFKVNSEKIIVIYPGVIVRRPVGSSQAELLIAFGVSKPFLFYIGVWRDHKNLPGLVAAFNILKAEFKLDLQLVLGGQPDRRYPEILAAINRSEFRSDIILPGFIPEADLSTWYAAAKLFILPSFCEGFGLVAIESLAQGTPVVGSSTTSLPEILGDSALYFNPDNPADMALVIKKVLTDVELAKNLVEFGQKQLLKYNWSKTASATLALYNAII